MLCIIHSVKENQTLLNYTRIVCGSFCLQKYFMPPSGSCPNILSSLSFQAISVSLKYFLSFLILQFLPSSQQGACQLRNTFWFLLSFLIFSFCFSFKFRFCSSQYWFHHLLLVLPFLSEQYVQQPFFSQQL